MPRASQGAGRHDSPARFGAWYCSRDPVAAVAECLQPFRGHHMSDDDFARVDGTRQALAQLSLADTAALLDLDDPRNLVERRLRPSGVATLRRTVTQRLAESIFDEGVCGLLWWSALEAHWINATLFYERTRPHVSLFATPMWLTTDLPEVREASAILGIVL